MIASMTLILVLALTGAIQAHSVGYDYSQRLSRPTTYTVNLPLYQRIAAALSNAVGHHDGAGCIVNHPQDPDQGEVVQSAPHVSLYNSNYHQPQLNPNAYNLGHVPYNAPLAYSGPVSYPHTVALNRLRTVQRSPIGYPPIQSLPLEGVVPPVHYGYHHQSAYLQPLY